MLLPARELELRAPAGGRLSWVGASLGDAVAAGQTLLRIEAPAAEGRLARAEASMRAAAAELEQARAALATAEDRLSRRRQLAELFAGEERVAAENEAKRASAAVAAAEAATASARAEAEVARRDLGELAIAAPFAGRVLQLHRPAGAAVAAGEPLLRLADDRGLLLRFAALPAAAAALRPGQRLTFRPLSPAGESADFTAELLQLAPGVDGPSGLVFGEARPAAALPFGLEVAVFADAAAGGGP